MTSSPLLFVIVGKNEPLYEAEFNKPPGGQMNDNIMRQNYFVLHSALDLVDRSAWTNPSMNLKVVDKVNHQHVSAFMTASNIKFMLLHAGKGDDAIRNFFVEVYEYYVKVSSNDDT